MAPVHCSKGIHRVTLTWWGGGGAETRAELPFCQVKFAATFTPHIPHPSGTALRKCQKLPSRGMAQKHRLSGELSFQQPACSRPVGLFVKPKDSFELF
jgi:hypothetical protein